MKLKYAVYQGGFIPHVILTQNLLQLSTENNCMFSVCDETYGYSAAAPFFFFFFGGFREITSYSFINRSHRNGDLEVALSKTSSSLNPMH